MSEPAAPEAHASGVLPYDPHGAKIGMWLFLFTEVLLFGALFIIYAVYLGEFGRGFQLGSAELSIPMGGLNTLVLLTSSLTMALSIAALQRRDHARSQKFLNITLVCAVVFLIIKAFEWGTKFQHHLYPGSEHLLQDLSKGENVYFALYYTMTGLHALHVLIGMTLIFWCKARIRKGTVSTDRIVFLENAGLYWHLVDLVWIFLFPLFYLLH